MDGWVSAGGSVSFLAYSMRAARVVGVASVRVHRRRQAKEVLWRYAPRRCCRRSIGARGPESAASPPRARRPPTPQWSWRPHLCSRSKASRHRASTRRPTMCPCTAQSRDGSGARRRFDSELKSERVLKESWETWELRPNHPSPSSSWAILFILGVCWPGFKRLAGGMPDRGVL